MRTGSLTPWFSISYAVSTSHEDGYVARIGAREWDDLCPYDRGIGIAGQLSYVLENRIRRVISLLGIASRDIKAYPLSVDEDKNCMNLSEKTEPSPEALCLLPRRQTSLLPRKLIPDFLHTIPIPQCPVRLPLKFFMEIPILSNPRLDGLVVKYHPVIELLALLNSLDPISPHCGCPLFCPFAGQ